MTSPLADPTWMKVFFESSILLMVFALGLPAYVYQVITPEDLKRVAGRHILLLGRPVLLMAILYLLLAAAFLLVLPRRDPATAHQSACLLMLLGIVVTLVFWLVMSLQDVRQLILRRVVDETLRIDWSGTINPKPLGDLIEIGRSIPQGKSRRDVLRALKDVIDEAQKKSYGYSGRSLEEVLHGLELILTGAADDLSAEEDFLLGAQILHDTAHFARRLEAQRNWPGARDAGQALEAIGRLGEICLEKRFLKAAYAYLEGAALDPKILARLGHKALEVAAHSIAVTCLSRLGAQALREGIDSPAGSALSGLLAAFWCDPKTRRISREQAQMWMNLVQGDLEAHLTASREQSLQHLDFVTADRLDRMIDELEKERKASPSSPTPGSAPQGNTGRKEPSAASSTSSR